MSDIVITAKRIKTELATFAACLLIGFLANFGAIIYYKTSYSELFTSLPYVLLLVLFLYILWSAIRIIFWLAVAYIRKLAKKQ